MESRTSGEEGRRGGAGKRANYGIPGMFGCLMCMRETDRKAERARPQPGSLDSPLLPPTSGTSEEGEKGRMGLEGTSSTKVNLSTPASLLSCCDLWLLPSLPPPAAHRPPGLCPWAGRLRTLLLSLAVWAAFAAAAPPLPASWREEPQVGRLGPPQGLLVLAALGWESGKASEGVWV